MTNFVLDLVFVICQICLLTGAWLLFAWRWKKRMERQMEREIEKLEDEMDVPVGDLPFHWSFALVRLAVDKKDETRDRETRG